MAIAIRIEPPPLHQATLTNQLLTNEAILFEHTR